MKISYMTKQPIAENNRDLFRIGALAMLVVSGQVAYSLYVFHFWLTLAILSLKVCFTFGTYALFFQRKGVSSQPQTVPPPALLSSYSCAAARSPI